MMERIAALGADYLATIGALARTEAVQDAARLRAAARATALAAAVTVLGVLWLNVGVLLWLLTTPYPIVGAFAIGAIVLLVGLAMGGVARAAASGGCGCSRAPAGCSPTSSSAAIRPCSILRRRRCTRRSGRAAAHDPRGAARDRRAAPRTAGRSGGGVRRDRALRAAQPHDAHRAVLWRAIGRVPQGTAMAGAAGLLALGSPTLRRLLAVLALLRNLGARRPPSARPGRGASSFPSA